MKRRQPTLLVALALVVITILALGLLSTGAAAVDENEPTQVAASTVVNANITSDTTWTPAGSPYNVISSVSVAAGATLTIEPGVEVVVSATKTFTVNGTLLAKGTAEQPIVFTGATKTNGSWYGVYVSGTTLQSAVAALEYVTIEYGGANQGNLYLSNAEVTATNSTFRNASNDGIRASSNVVASITDSAFTGNAGYAINFGSGSVNPVLARLTASGNGHDVVFMGTGTMQGAHVWEYTGIPYMAGSLTMASGGTLTVEPGVDVAFDGPRTLEINGNLEAIGTSEQPIIFTGVEKTAGTWYGVYVVGTAEQQAVATLKHVTIEYGGANQSNLYLSNADVTVNFSTFRNSKWDGIRSTGAVVASVRDSTFTGNGGYAINFTSGAAHPALARLTATGNGNNAVFMGTGTMHGAHVWEYTGIPYMAGTLKVAAGSTLTVEPGVEVAFDGPRTLEVNGTLRAAGTAERRILFTSVGKTPGSWYGIKVAGTATANANAVLSHATVEYGTTNVAVNQGRASISHSVIRHAMDDGFNSWAGGGGSVIELSQVYGNGRYGVRNSDSGTTNLLAANNWWGDDSGPRADIDCGVNGTGDSVSSGVGYRPFLTDPNQVEGTALPPEAMTLSLSPQRWFVPADGVTRAWVTMTLRDGAGRPVSGRAVSLHNSLGGVVSGGHTDPNGQALAYVTSTTAGEATLTGSLAVTECEAVRKATSTITFTPFTPGGSAGLTETPRAPYANGSITIDPLPVTQGVPATLRVRLTNPNAFPISVNGTFGIAQLGIGLAFGPVGSVENHVIPANSESVIEKVWTPPASGHFCITFDAAYQAAGSAAVSAPQPFSVQSLAEVGQVGVSDLAEFEEIQKNTTGKPGSLSSAEKNDALAKAERATGVIGMAPGTKGLSIPKRLVGSLLNWVYRTTRQIDNALKADPPRQDFKVIAQAEKPMVDPVQPGDGMSAARAAAINSLTDSLLDVIANGRAAIISFDRYGGAAEAGDAYWGAHQAAALDHFSKEMGSHLKVAADRTDAFVQLMQDEGEADGAITADDIRAYQAVLAATGFTAEEIQAAKVLGLTDAEIEAYRQEILAADPDLEAVPSLMDYYTNWARENRYLGNVLVNSKTFPTTSSAGGLSTAATDSNLARVYANSTTLVIGNPLATTATIDLRARRVDLPPDWMVTVSPASVTLGPGEQTTVTVIVEPGTAAVQGTVPRVAIEGYVGDQMLENGGVVIDVMVPEALPFGDAGKHRVYLPLVVR